MEPMGLQLLAALLIAAAAIVNYWRTQDRRPVATAPAAAPRPDPYDEAFATLGL